MTLTTNRKSTRARLPLMLGPCAIFAMTCSTGCQSSSTPANDPLPAPLRGDVATNTQQASADTDRAYALIQNGKFDDALPILQQAIIADALYGPAHNDLGLVYYHQDQAYQAAREFQNAAKLMPTRGEPLNNLGLVYEKADKLSDAERSYRLALDLDPENTEYAGNLARARLRQDELDGTTRKLLELIIAKDQRPEWVQWAKSNLHRTSSISTQPNHVSDP